MSTPTNRRPTMKDVANLAGASLKSVSRVVNDEPNVSDALRRRVVDAVEELDYKPDDRARQLRRSEAITASIGLITVDVSNPFTSRLHRGIEDVAREHGYLTMAGSCDEELDRARDIFRAFVARRVDGIIAFPVAGFEDALAGEVERGLPVVCVDRALPHLLCDTVVTDNAGGTRAATDHLLAHGHTRIGFLGDRTDIWTARERLRGHREAMAGAGRRVDESLVVQGLGSVEDAEDAVAALLDGPTPPTALLTAQNLISMGAIRHLSSRGRQHEVALVSFDDVTFARELDPPVTAVPQDPYEMGRRAAAHLFDRLGGHGGPPRMDVLPVELVVRGSGELPVPHGT